MKSKKINVFALVPALIIIMFFFVFSFMLNAESDTITSDTTTNGSEIKVEKVSRSEYEGFAGTEYTETALIGMGMWLFADSKDGWDITVAPASSMAFIGTIDVAYKKGNEYFTETINVNGPVKHFIGNGSGRNKVTLLKVRSIEGEINPHLIGLD